MFEDSSEQDSGLIKGINDRSADVHDRDLCIDDFFDRSDPRSLYNIVPMWMRDAIDRIDPRILLYGDVRLREISNADSKLNRIRLAFWSEYEEAQAMVKNIDFWQITRKTGITATFAKSMITQSQYTLAYVLNQPVEYSQFLEEALNAGLGRLREILDAPIVDADTGKIDPRMAELMLKATAFIDLRVNGGITEKRVNMNLNQNHSVHEHVFKGNADRTKSARLLTGNASSAALEALDEKIRELEQKAEYKEARAIMPEPEIITIESMRGEKSPEKTRAIDTLMSTKKKVILCGYGSSGTVNAGNKNRPMGHGRSKALKNQ